MKKGPQKAFFAYPAFPKEISRTIETAFPDKNRPIDGLSVHIWPLLDLFGSFIPDEIRRTINDSDLLIGDITIPNPNVYYEIGYAIGRGKTVLPVVNSSYSDSEKSIQKQGLFDNIAYRKYQNSDELIKNVQEFDEIRLNELYSKDINYRQPLFILDTYTKTDFRNYIVSAVKESRVFFRSFDPVETPRFSTIHAITEISASSGVIVPVLAPHIVDSEPHNLRGAFIAGMAHAMGREVLLVRMRDEAQIDPADYRQKVSYVSNRNDIDELVNDFCRTASVSAQSIDPIQQRKARSSLRSISLGAVAAENEFRALDRYFVETAEFGRTARGEVNIVTGRKGSGKSAIFFQVRDLLRRSKENLVIDLKPESHQISHFRGELQDVSKVGLVDHTMAAFWYFVIISEILLSFVKNCERRGILNNREADFVARAKTILGEHSFLESGDFTTRLNKIAKDLKDAIKFNKDKSIRLTIEEVTNIIYSRSIPEVRSLVVEIAKELKQVYVLFDNIDKGWPSTGVEDVDLTIVRLLIEALVKVRQDFSVRGVDFNSVVFLRNDIFELLLDSTPDRGKSARVSIDWTDRAKLKHVIFRRLQDGLKNYIDSFEKIWSDYFIEYVEDRSSFDFFLDHCLMRPRFLISTIELAIGNAINRGNVFVSEKDCIDAVRQYSYSLLDDFGFEIRDVSGISSEIMYAFVGEDRIISGQRIKECLMRSGLEDSSAEDALRLMLWYGALGICLDGGREMYIYNVEYKMKRLEGEMRTSRFSDLYAINHGLYVALADY